MAALDDISLVQVLVDAGFKDDGTLRDALAVVFAESGGNCSARHKNHNGSIDRGLFQINDRAHPDVTDTCAYDCLCNAQAAYRISNGGTNWHPWATWPAAASRHYPDSDRALAAWRNANDVNFDQIIGTRQNNSPITAGDALLNLYLGAFYGGGDSGPHAVYPTVNKIADKVGANAAEFSPAVDPAGESTEKCKHSAPLEGHV
jgi:lysozyme-like protein